MMTSKEWLAIDAVFVHRMREAFRLYPVEDSEDAKPDHIVSGADDDQRRVGETVETLFIGDPATEFKFGGGIVHGGGGSVG